MIPDFRKRSLGRFCIFQPATSPLGLKKKKVEFKLSLETCLQ